MRDTKRRAELTAVLARAYPAASPANLVLIVTAAQEIAAGLHAIYERQCNGHQDARGNWDEGAAKRDEAREIKLQGELRKLVMDSGLSGFSARTQGDPRGAAVKLTIPGQPGDSFGGAADGWPVY